MPFRTVEKPPEAARYDAPMPLFASARERRLWLWTLVVVATIYLTLGVAGSVAGVLRESGLLEAATFVVGMLLVGAAVVTMRVRTRPGWGELGVWLGVAAGYLMVFVRMASPAERSHLIEYGVVAAFVHEALLEREGQGRRVPLPAVAAVVATALLGWLDEGIQAILPNRVYDIQDVLFNTLAAAMAVAARVALAWVRRRVGKGS